ncbi:protein kinase [Nonomuraea fuscirosea]|uniref:serine/threonine-protein kinase n=1 Tax=Nonomuraea fuscirosea TaxID=1291556 RepID=UPI002DD89A87|nr:protein kinase [Nonomuraea fuscirosea]WSA54735.1 protein kinase [Nonomuraea fuscirosea]
MLPVEDAPGYRVLDQAGQGGFAVVYRAYQERLDRVVALKVLSVDRVDQRTMRRFQRELQLTGRLTGHPNVVTVFDTGVTSSGKPYIAMDFFENGSLRDKVRKEGPLPVSEVLRAGVKLAGALAAVHEAGVLHGDIKPQNILISRYGELAIADFGVARVVDSSEISATSQAFTPLHAAPEVLTGQPHSASTDIYSLGSTLYHLLAGRPAFHNPADPSIAPLMYRVLSVEPPPINRPDVPRAVFETVVRAMSKQPESRYGSARELARRLQAVQADLGLPVTDLLGQDSGPAAATGGHPSQTGGGPPSTGHHLPQGSALPSTGHHLPQGGALPTTGQHAPQGGGAQPVPGQHPPQGGDAFLATGNHPTQGSGAFPATGSQLPPFPRQATGQSEATPDTAAAASAQAYTAPGRQNDLRWSPEYSASRQAQPGSTQPGPAQPNQAQPGPVHPHSAAQFGSAQAQHAQQPTYPPAQPPTTPQNPVQPGAGHRKPAGSESATRVRNGILVGGAVAVAVTGGTVLAVYLSLQPPSDPRTTPATSTAAPRQQPENQTSIDKSEVAALAPRQVKAAADQGALVELRWTLPAGARDYPVVLQRSPIKEGEQAITALSTGATSARVAGLDPNRGYCFLVGVPLRISENSTVAWSAPYCIRGARAKQGQ